MGGGDIRAQNTKHQRSIPISKIITPTPTTPPSPAGFFVPASDHFRDAGNMADRFPDAGNTKNSDHFGDGNDMIAVVTKSASLPKRNWLRINSNAYEKPRQVERLPGFRFGRVETQKASPSCFGLCT